MSQASQRLRPMTAADIVDEAINLYRRNFRTFIIIGAVAIVPLTLLQILFTLMFDNSDIALIGLSSLGTSILSFFAYVLMWAAMVRASTSAFLNEPVNERSAYNAVLSSFGPALGIAFIYGVAVVVLSFFIVGIYLAIAWIFAMHALIVEGRDVFASLGRSRVLVSGHWWRTLGISIIVVIIQGVVAVAFSIPAMIVGGSAMFSDPFAEISTTASVLGNIGNAAGIIVAGPIVVCASTLLYFDLRMRKEGFDLELQAREMEAALSRPAAPGRAF